MAYGTGLLRLLALKSEPKQMSRKRLLLNFSLHQQNVWLPIGIQSYSRMMNGMSKHLQNAYFFGSITILRRWLDP